MQVDGELCAQLEADIHAILAGELPVCSLMQHNPLIREGAPQKTRQ
jgi:hypothetical protein